MFALLWQIFQPVLQDFDQIISSLNRFDRDTQSSEPLEIKSLVFAMFLLDFSRFWFKEALPRTSSWQIELKLISVWACLPLPLSLPAGGQNFHFSELGQSVSCWNVSLPWPKATNLGYFWMENVIVCQFAIWQIYYRLITLSKSLGWRVELLA